MTKDVKPKCEDEKTSAKPKEIRGKPKSGRVWKSPRTERHSNLTMDKQLKTSWAGKMKAKSDKQALKLLMTEIADKKKAEKEGLKQRREENQKRREENARKAEIVQPIVNTTKIKRMKKKQLRKIQKRDLDKGKVVKSAATSKKGEKK